MKPRPKTLVQEDDQAVGEDSPQKTSGLICVFKATTNVGWALASPDVRILLEIRELKYRDRSVESTSSETHTGLKLHRLPCFLGILPESEGTFTHKSSKRNFLGGIDNAKLKTVKASPRGFLSTPVDRAPGYPDGQGKMWGPVSSLQPGKRRVT